jgi:hypothetical protein
MPLIVDPRFTQSALVGNVNAAALAAPAAPEEEAPAMLDTLDAAARTSLPGRTYDRLSTPDAPDVEAPPGYDALDDIAGYEDMAEQFVAADTPGEVAGIKGRIDRERTGRETLRRSGWVGTASELFFGVVDPSFLAAIAVPELGIAHAVRLSKVLTSAGRGAAVAGAHEIGMHALEETRTLEQSAINVGAGTLLAGVLGSLGRQLPKEQAAQLRSALREEFPMNPEPGSQSFGAASARRATTLEAESLAAGGQGFSKFVGKVPMTETDLQKVMRSDSVEARTVLQDFAEVGPVLSKNLEGVPTPHSVECLVIRHEGRVADFVHELRRLYAQHRKDPRPVVVGTPALSRKEFYAAVAGAARRGDKDVFPHVREAAQYLRARVFDPLKHQAQKLGLLPPDAEIDLFADSYFRRMYSRDAIRARRGDWDAILERHFAAKGMSQAEARTTADDITRRILGADVGLANFNLRSHVPTAGPLHERVLDIRDELIESFLVSDPQKVASAYVRELAPQIEMHKRFGDKDARDAFQRIRDEYGVLRTKAAVEGNHGRVNALQDQEKATLEALIRVRDRVLGKAGTIGPDASIGERAGANLLRGWRNLVASARLGMTALTGGTMDLSRIVATEGFAPTVQRLAQLIAKPEFRKLSRDSARRLGVASEVALARRVNVASDGAMTEGWTQRLADATYRVSGLNHVTDFYRTLAATLIEDKLLGAAARVAAGETLEKGLRTDLARLGFDGDALRRVHAQVEAHGATVDGIRTSGSMQWRDSRLAELYDSAIVKEARTLVLEPGAANRTWWADGEIGKTIGQIKSFALAAPLKLTMAPVQLLGQRRYLDAARFVGAMMVGGTLVHALRQTASGMTIQTDPKALAGEAFVESGLVGILPDLLSPIARRFGVLGESARFSDRNVASAYGGPAIGFGADMYDMVMNRTADGMNAKDLQLLRRLLPLNQVWWFRRGVNAVQGEIGEALELEGATTDTFTSRALETRQLASSTARGGTGTGQVVQ